MSEDAGGDVARRDDDGRPLGQELAELVGRLSSDDDMDRETRGRLLGRFARLLTASARRAGAAGFAGGRWLADIVIDIAPHLPIRDLDRLRAHHGGLTGEALAESLVRTAQKATTGVGAAGGALAAVEFAAPPLLLTAPAQIVAETVAVALIEVKLIAELHEVYGVQVPGNGKARAGRFIQAWATQRGVDPLKPGTVTAALGAASKAGLRKRMLRLLGRHLTTLGPFLTGAVAGGVLNRAATRKVSDAVRHDLRRQVGRVPVERPPLSA